MVFSASGFNTAFRKSYKHSCICMNSKLECFVHTAMYFSQISTLSHRTSQTTTHFYHNMGSHDVCMHTNYNTSTMLKAATYPFSQLH